MELTVIITVTDEPNVGVQTRARGVPEAQIRPTLLLAQRALQAEVDALEDCPFHNRSKAPDHAL